MNDPGDDPALTPSEDEQEPDWAEQIRKLRKQRGAKLEERLTEPVEDEGRPIPDL